MFPQRVRRPFRTGEATEGKLGQNLGLMSVRNRDAGSSGGLVAFCRPSTAPVRHSALNSAIGYCAFVREGGGWDEL